MSIIPQVSRQPRERVGRGGLDAGAPALSSGQDRLADLQYGGETFLAARELLERHRAGSGRSRLLPRRGDVSGLRAMVALLWRLPSVRVSLTESPAGERIGEYLGFRKWGLIPDNRIAQGVLPVPATITEHLRGRQRQALRTNLNRARDARISVTALPAAADRRWALERWAKNCATRAGDDVGRLQRYLEERADEPGRRWLAALDGSGECVGVCLVTVDVECALLEHLVAPSPARWALNAAVVDMLCEEGISFLFAESTNGIRAEKNIQYLHHLLGYRVAHILVRHERRGARGL